ncbi:mechanosensitive ion channel domain-containing protein [Marinagarivorans algicola]|uniref:mechanosensitive ion channel domain-containing protein n=1 Tax=Marinagarivorans algicola TaxID=1513270 RepID=UPI0006B62B81|nr:mechanosensitive ion channel domain-containing protein [Marinagarivorans algicola]
MLDEITNGNNTLVPNLQTISQIFTVLEGVFLLACLICMLLAKYIIEYFSDKIPAPKRALRVAGVRGICLAAISILMYIEVPSELSQQYGLVTALAILASVYLCYLGNFISAYFIFKRFGKSRTIGQNTITIPTYQTRALSLLSSLFFLILAIVAIVQQLGFSNLLEAGGVIGVIGVMLALTQGSWAPDIISGLILLNSDMIEEGDILELPNGTIAEVFKTKMFHTELFDIAHNNRIMVRNTTLRDRTLSNLSRFASHKGLRICLPFNIDYQTPAEAVEALFEQVGVHASEQDIAFESTHGIKTVLMEAGDHALQWGFIFHTKAPEQLIDSKRSFRLLMQQEAHARNISLATPLTHIVNLEAPPKAQQAL